MFLCLCKLQFNIQQIHIADLLVVWLPQFILCLFLFLTLVWLHTVYHFTVTLSTTSLSAFLFFSISSQLVFSNQANHAIFRSPSSPYRYSQYFSPVSLIIHDKWASISKVKSPCQSIQVIQISAQRDHFQEKSLIMHNLINYA